MTNLYPLKFTPIFKDKLWGGNKIHTILNKDFSPLPNCGETWEISGVKGNESIVAQGELKGKSLPELIESYKEELVGEKVFKRFHHEFPLLIKFIDANDDLSIQVHPDDELAQKRHDSLGKSEMWYILQADPGASLISGFNQPMSKEKYLEYFNSGRLTEILNREEVKPGDVFYMPAGRVHSIGKGILLAEIQETSDVTYRIYDFDRKDADGKLRQLHVEEALDAIDYTLYENYKTNYETQLNEPVNVVDCQYFTTNVLNFDESLLCNYADLDSFVIYIVTEGRLQIVYNENQRMDAQKGDVLLIPASLKKILLNPSGRCNVLEAYIK
jgi:mannose-6-phosphate isomerase